MIQWQEDLGLIVTAGALLAGFVSFVFIELDDRRARLRPIEGHVRTCLGTCGGMYPCAGCAKVVGFCDGGDDAMPEHCTQCWWTAYGKHEAEHGVEPGMGCAFCDEDGRAVGMENAS